MSDRRRIPHHPDGFTYILQPHRLGATRDDPLFRESSRGESACSCWEGGALLRSERSTSDMITFQQIGSSPAARLRHDSRHAQLHGSGLKRRGLDRPSHDADAYLEDPCGEHIGVVSSSHQGVHKQEPRPGGSCSHLACRYRLVYPAEDAHHAHQGARSAAPGADGHSPMNRLALSDLPLRDPKYGGQWMT